MVRRMPKQRLELILATIAGQVTVVEAAQRTGHQRSDVLQAAERACLQVSSGGSGAQADWSAAAAAQSGRRAECGVGSAGRGLGARTGGPDGAVGVGADDAASGEAGIAGAEKNESPPLRQRRKHRQPSVASRSPACRARCNMPCRQQPAREREQRARQAAVQFVDQQLPSCRRAARCLAMSSRTLAYWRRRQARGELIARPRGRACREPTGENRLAVRSLLEETGPRLGLPTLQACCPEMPPCVLTYLLRGYRRQFQAEHRW